MLICTHKIVAEDIRLVVAHHFSVLVKQHKNTSGFLLVYAGEKKIMFEFKKCNRKKQRFIIC